MKKTQILIVDDEPDFIRLASFNLKKLGYEVATAAEGQEALDLVRAKQPDLVLMDIVLKGRMDGIEAAEQIRSLFNIPVVYLTAHTDDEMLTRAKVTEPFGYIIKPFEDRELKIVVEIALHKARIESKLKASKASFHNIVEKSADGIIVVDRDGIVQFVNKAAEVLFGRKAEELLGELFGYPVMVGEMTEVDIISRNRENGAGEMCTVETEWESKPACLVLIRDITDRKRVEEELIQTNKRLEEHDLLKNKFVADVSHEFRTPLSIFKNILSNAMSGVQGKISEKLRHDLKIADEEIDKLARIVSNILDVSRIEAGRMKLNLAPLDIRCVVSEVISSWEPVAAARGMEIRGFIPDSELLVNADRAHIAQILANLISNAIKFVPEVGGKISVRVKDLDDEVGVDVEDNGLGIEKDDIDNVFNRFVQAKKLVRPGEHGIGLGLAICKELIEMNGGRIWVETVPGQGANFCFVLPKFSMEQQRTYEGKQHCMKKKQCP